jgi:hypothetical protein
MRPLLFIIFLASSKLIAQDKSDVAKLIPKKFIYKVELLAGPNITFPNGSDNASFNNPRISTGYYPKAGYLIGIGLTHTIERFELCLRILSEQKGYTQKLWDNEPSSLFEFTNDTKNNFLSFNFIPTLSLGKSKRFNVLMGIKYSHLNNSESIQTRILNGKTQSVFRTTNASNQGISDQLVEAIAGFGYLVYAKNKKEVSATIQGDYGLTNMVNQNGTTIRNSSLNLIIAFKIIR